MSDEDARKALEAMGISLEEAIEADAKSRERLSSMARDPRICLCGHATARHTVVNGVVFCKPSRMECPCKKVRPVLEADDTRKFLRRTTGSGALHALTLGIVSHAQTGKSVRWIVDLVCDRCGASDNNVVPAAVTQQGRATNSPTGFDALLCPTCRTEV
jgi:hypothetical protein